MSAFPRDGYRALELYQPDRDPVAVDLCDNTNLWGTHPAALEAARSAAPESLIRYPTVYADRLRDGIAARFGVPADCVATGCGSDDVLDSTFRAVCHPGARVAYLAPTFSMIGPLATMNGLEALPFDEHPRRPEPARLLEARPALVYLCRPNNPTGGLLDRAWIERLLEAGGDAGPVVLVDEAYLDFSGDAGLLGEAPASARLVVLRTFSKAYGLAGLRVGFAVGPAEVIAEIEKSRGPYKVGHLAELAALAALDDRDGWVPGVVKEVRRNRTRLAEALRERGSRPLPSEANFLLAPLPPELERLGAVGAARALRRRQVAVRPFPETPGIGDALRVTLGPWPLLERFLEALDEVIAEEAG